MCVFGRLALPVTVGYALSRLAKVDVEGSNPFSRSKPFKRLGATRTVAKSARDEFRYEF